MCKIEMDLIVITWDLGLISLVDNIYYEASLSTCSYSIIFSSKLRLDP